MRQILQSNLSIVAGFLLFWFPNLRDGYLRGMFGMLITFTLLFNCSTLPYEEEIDEDPNTSGKVMISSIDRLVLVNALTNEDILQLNDFSEFYASSLSIRAETGGASVIFELSGPETHRFVDSTKPFTLKGDNSGVYKEWIPAPGTYTLKVTPYAKTGGAGRAGISKTIKFNVLAIAGEKSSISAPVDYYFNQDFNAVSLTSSGETKKFNGWNLLGATTYLSDVYIWAHKPPYTDIQMNTALDGGRNSLFLRVNDDDPVDSWTTRAQMQMTFKDGVDIGVYHTSHRMYFSPDLGFLTNYSGTLNWVSVFEVWNKRNPNWDGDQAGSSRISLYVNKVSGEGHPLHWTVSSQYTQPASILWNAVWPAQTNKIVPVPIGKWFTMDVYLKRGEGTNGQFKVTITPDGGIPAILFDIKGHTIYPGYPELTLKNWQVFKFYIGDPLLDWMRSKNKIAFAQYNDFKWFKN
jgi:hypothetical protein